MSLVVAGPELIVGAAVETLESESTSKLS